MVHGFDAGEMGPKALAEHISARVGDAPVYVSFDIDALDPAYCARHRNPGLRGSHHAGGDFTLRRLGGLNLKGFDVVEVSPLSTMRRSPRWQAPPSRPAISAFWQSARQRVFPSLSETETARS